MDPSRRTILATGAAAAALAAAQRVLGRQIGQGTDASFYERGPVRIYYEEAGSGIPLLVIPGGGLNSTFSGLARGPFDPIAEFAGEYRCIGSDLRNANNGQSSDGGRDARTAVRGERFPVETASGADSSACAPDTVLPTGASVCFGLEKVHVPLTPKSGSSSPPTPAPHPDQPRCRARENAGMPDDAC
jgi:hypothetical protein